VKNANAARNVIDKKTFATGAALLPSGEVRPPAQTCVLNVGIKNLKLFQSDSIQLPYITGRPMNGLR
jgi:hypothetical protein